MSVRVASGRILGVLMAASSVLFLGGMVASVIEGIRLATPTPMPTLPTGTYTGYAFPHPSSGLERELFLLFVGISALGATLLIVTIVLTVTRRRIGIAASA
jgi:hypothetical protein